LGGWRGPHTLERFLGRTLRGHAILLVYLPFSSGWEMPNVKRQKAQTGLGYVVSVKVSLVLVGHFLWLPAVIDLTNFRRQFARVP
jgi:hypothetical protein